MGRESRFDVMAHVVEIANSSVDVAERLDNILGEITSYLDARLAVLFMQEQRGTRLASANYWPRSAALPQGLSVPFGQGALGNAARSRAPSVFTFTLPSEDPVLEQFCRNQEKVALFPVMDDNRLYAVLVLVFEKGGDLNDEDVRLLQMVVREMAGSIRNFHLYFEAKKRIAELNVLSDLGRAAVSTIEIDELLKIVAGICAKLLGAKGGLIKVRSINGEEQTMQAVHGLVPAGCANERFCYLDEESRAKGEGSKPCECDADKAGNGNQQAMCMPLKFKSRVEGQLCVFEKVVASEGQPFGFSDEDRSLLTTMSSMVSAALDNALTFQQVEDLAQRNEEMVNALATLHEISTVLMTTVDFDETVLIILHAVVHPVGLDHDRVLLFLSDDDGKTVRPIAEFSKELEGMPRGELTRTLLDLKDHHDRLPGITDQELAQLEVVLRPGEGVMALTLELGAPIKIDDPAGDPRVGPVLHSVLGDHPFISVPMFAKGKPVGVMLVNNYLSRRPITDRDQKLLTMLANQGGLSVETSRLYRHLEDANREMAAMRSRLLEADKLAALGEVAAGVAHEIRNPLVSIGGFTRRIRKKVGDNSQITPYLDVIIEEVTRLERTLNEMLDFSTDSRSQYEEVELNNVMDSALELLRRELEENRIEVARNYADDTKVYCDERQIKHVFLNLYLNAIQAMGPEGGRLTLRTFKIMREAKSFVAGEVTDTGGGIPMNVIHNIFNPFFTTKDTGSGLGLSIVHKIVTRHFGQVEVHTQEGKGATMLVTLPAAEEGRAYLK